MENDLTERKNRYDWIAEVVAVGDELCSGQRLDTNSQWLSQQLGSLGIPVSYHSAVADDLAAMKNVLAHSVARAEVVVVTGGLGPTADDLTREAIADIAGVELEFDEATLESIRTRYARRGREMPDNNRRQAWFPAGCSIIPNPRGTAPGIEIRLPGQPGSGHPCYLFALPGVPAEMKPMWADHVAPAIRRVNPDPSCIVHRNIHCFGAGESDIELRLPDLIRRGNRPAVGITASSGTITLRISARGKTTEECEDQIWPVESVIRDCLGDLVFGDSNQTLQGVVVELLQKNGQTLAVMDAGVGGLISGWLYRADPDRTVFRGAFGSLPTSSNSKSEMARARKTMEADCVLFVGYESGADHPGRPIAISRGDSFEECHIHSIRDSTIAVKYAAKQALNFLRKRLS